MYLKYCLPALADPLILWISITSNYGRNRIGPPLTSMFGHISFQTSSATEIRIFWAQFLYMLTLCFYIKLSSMPYRKNSCLHFSCTTQTNEHVVNIHFWKLHHIHILYVRRVVRSLASLLLLIFLLLLLLLLSLSSSLNTNASTMNTLCMYINVESLFTCKKKRK